MLSNRKIAMITGASRGIGEAIARAFAQEHYHLILTCHKNKDLLDALTHELESTYQISCLSFVGDIGDAAFVKSIFDTLDTMPIWHDIDVLVNNAGVSYIGLLSDMDPCDWQMVLHTNLTSAFLCSKYVIPKMVQKQSGKIINISSIWGNIGASMEVAYSASKSGLNGFTRALAKELAPSHIQVNAIACGVIDTTMNACFDESEVTALIEDIPADRLGRPDEVGQLALSLAASGDYLTGQIIGLDGGWG
ncbi:MAG: SDR family NAD(P)-dependent oxidoreductase [Lachnospiraceae bacterium]